MFTDFGFAAQLPIWHYDKHQVCNAIAIHKAPFKIILKTKNEPERLKSWIAHHASIAGIENLIIFDHMSTDLAVLSIYAEHQSRFPIIRFHGFHNNLHNVSIFPELYAALRQSCGYYCFLDTDEYLALYDGADRFNTGGSILDYLASHPETLVFPGTWLHALEGNNDRFKLKQPFAALSDGLCWGKPVISSKLEVSGIILHNKELNHAMVPSELTTNLFVLHRHKSDPQQRIRINLLKLKSYGVIKPEQGLIDVLALDPDALKIGQNYVREIQSLTESVNTRPDTEGTIHILTDGGIVWFKPWQRAEMQRFISAHSMYDKQLFS